MSWLLLRLVLHASCSCILCNR